MSKIAIDVALLPPDEIMDKAIAINSQHGPRFSLNKEDRLPHITLSQAVVKVSDLGEAEAKLQAIASEFSPLRLTARLAERPSILFEISPTKQLQDLHEAIMDSFKKLVFYDAKTEYFYDDVVRESSLDWVRNFRTDAAYKKYYPHISLAVTKPVKGQHKVSFAVNRLTICQLGNYNTCRKILVEIKL
jgi:hypothetical protein